MKRRIKKTKYKWIRLAVLLRFVDDKLDIASIVGDIPPTALAVFVRDVWRELELIEKVRLLRGLAKTFTRAWISKVRSWFIETFGLYPEDLYKYLRHIENKIQNFYYVYPEDIDIETANAILKKIKEMDYTDLPKKRTEKYLELL